MLLVARGANWLSNEETVSDIAFLLRQIQSAGLGGDDLGGETYGSVLQQCGDGEADGDGENYDEPDFQVNLLSRK